MTKSDHVSPAGQGHYCGHSSPPHMVWILKPKFVQYTWEDNLRKKLILEKYKF